MAAAALAAMMPGAALAQQKPATTASEEPDAAAEEFLATLKQGKAGTALNVLASTSPRLRKMIDEDGRFEAQIDASLTSYGPVTGWERVSSQKLGTMARLDVYLVQQRDFVTRWRFGYVRAGSGWTMAFFTFEDQVQSWFGDPGPLPPAPAPR